MIYEYIFLQLNYIQDVCDIFSYRRISFFLTRNAVSIDQKRIIVGSHVPCERLIVAYRRFLPSVYRNDVIADH